MSSTDLARLREELGALSQIQESVAVLAPVPTVKVKIATRSDGGWSLDAQGLDGDGVTKLCAEIGASISAYHDMYWLEQKRKHEAVEKAQLNQIQALQMSANNERLFMALIGSCVLLLFILASILTWRWDTERRFMTGTGQESLVRFSSQH